MVKINFFLKKDANNRYYFVIKVNEVMKEVVSSSYESRDEIYKALMDLSLGTFVIEEHFGFFYFTVIHAKHQIICTSSNFETYEGCASFIEVFKAQLEKEGEKIKNLCNKSPN